MEEQVIELFEKSENIIQLFKGKIRRSILTALIALQQKIIYTEIIHHLKVTNTPKQAYRTLINNSFLIDRLKEGKETGLYYWH